MIEEYGIIQHNENNEIYFTSIGLKPKFAHFYGVKNTDKIYELKFDFPRFETIEEQNKRLANKAKLREIEKEKMINEIKSFFKLHPELKEEILNS